VLKNRRGDGAHGEAVEPGPLPGSDQDQVGVDIVRLLHDGVGRRPRHDERVRDGDLLGQPADQLPQLLRGHVSLNVLRDLPVRHGFKHVQDRDA